MTSDEVLDMSDDDLLDMDYFLHEFDESWMMTISAKKVLYLLNLNRLISRARFLCGLFSFKSSTKVELSYKNKKADESFPPSTCF